MINMVSTAIASTALISALLVVAQAVHSPVNAVLWLIVSFVAVACYLITCGITFLGLSYVIVYVGAIAVLFLFVVIILNLAEVPDSTIIKGTNNAGLSRNKMWPVAILILLIGGVVVIPIGQHITGLGYLPLGILEGVHSLLYGTDTVFGTLTSQINQATTYTPLIGTQVSPISQVQILGLTLYTHGALWLILISILLMLAILVPLALAFTS